MHNFLYLLIFNVVGIALNLIGKWISQGKEFSLKSNVPQAIGAFVVGGTISYFVDKPIVQALMIILAQLAIGVIFSGIAKLGKK